MMLQLAPLPSLPADTTRAAGALFGKGNLYLTIGDQVDLLLSDIYFADFDTPYNKPASLVSSLALVNIFQYMEELPDRQASEATRVRVDWKYALHLSLDHPGINTATLCHYRQWFLQDKHGQSVFSQVFARFNDTGLLREPGKTNTSASDVLCSVCLLTRLESVSQAMSRAIEAAVACNPQWLRAITLPHWYERYTRTLAPLKLPRCKEEQTALAQTIGTDINYLLNAASVVPEACNLPEIRLLNLIKEQQYRSNGNQVMFMAPYCTLCGSGEVPAA